jgi:hypothetical protein
MNPSPQIQAPLPSTVILSWVGSQKHLAAARVIARPLAGLRSMSKQPHSFTNKSELVSHLAATRHSIDFKSEPNLVFLVRNSIGANTFRAFRRK